MRKTILILLSISTVVLGGLCVWQARQLRVESERHRAVETAMRAEAEAREQESLRAKDAESRAVRLEREVAEFNAVTSNLRARDSAQSSNLTALAERMKSLPAGAGDGAGAGKEGNEGIFGKEMGNMLSNMLKDPDMRKMLRGQQRAAIEMSYGGLLKQMQLNPDEKARLMDLLVDSQMRQIENSQGLFGGDGDDTPEAAARSRAQTEQSNREMDEQIKALLGEERFAEYKDYEKNIGERMQLNQLQTRLESANLPLQEQQSAQLLQLMQEEKTKVPPVFPTDARANPADMKALMTSENLEKQLQWMDDYNKRVRERAAAVLTPEQLQRFQEFQDEQAAMQKMGLKMAQGMFGGKGSGAGAGTPTSPK